MWTSRQEVLQLKAVQNASRRAESGVGETGEEGRRFERLPGSEPVTKVEGIQSADDSALIGRSTFDCETPTAAPSEFTEPHRPMTFIGLANTIDCEPGVRLIPSTAAPALNHTFADLQVFALELPFSRPASREVMQPVRSTRRQRPGCQLRALQCDRLRCTVLNPS